MNRPIIPIIVAVLVLILGAWFAWQQITELETKIDGLNSEVTDLGTRLGDAEALAEEAQIRADRAEEDAEQALREAGEAWEREQESSRRAEVAEAARTDAEARERAAAAARQEAELAADQAAIARAKADQEKAAAEKREAEMTLAAEAAREDAFEARAENRRLRLRMDREINRLQRAMGRIADTRRTALGLVLTLDSSQIEFDFDKAELRPQNREVLSRIAGVLLTFQDYGVQVIGHTDHVGSVEYNQELSEKRANVVRDYLVEAGIPEETLSTMGLGKSSPLVEGTDEEASQRNRRVELAIVFSEGEYEGLTDEAIEEVEAGGP